MTLLQNLNKTIDYDSEVPPDTSQDPHTSTSQGPTQYICKYKVWLKQKS